MVTNQEPTTTMTWKAFNIVLLLLFDTNTLHGQPTFIRLGLQLMTIFITINPLVYKISENSDVHHSFPEIWWSDVKNANLCKKEKSSKSSHLRRFDQQIFSI